MHKLLKQCFNLMLAVLVLIPFSVQAKAKAVFIITPSLTNISVLPGNTGTVSYSVVNNTSRVINQISVGAAYETNGNPTGINLQSDTCSGSTLAPRATCAFTVIISGSNQPNSFQVRPRVCGFNGTVCSVPLNNFIVAVVVPAAPAGTPVTVTSVNPSNTSVAVTTSQIVINFNAAMNPASINSSSVQVVQSGTSTNLISSCTESTPDGLSFACSFNSSLTTNQQYNVTVDAGVKSTAGGALAQNFTTNFLTAALIAGDGTTNTYYVNNANVLSISTSAGAFTPVTFSGGSPTGTIILLAGNGAGRMYFATSTNQIWQNSAGSAFTQSTTGAFTGNIIQLGGSGSTGDMYYATSTGQVWGSAGGAAFTQATVNGPITGTISQITGDGVAVACFMTTTNLAFCGFFNNFTPVTYSGGSLSGNIIRLTGIVNSSSPIDVSFYTSSNQLWQQSAPGSSVFDLVTFTGTQPTGIIQQMASNGNGAIIFVTTTNQVWSNHNTSTFTPETVNGAITGAASAMAGNGGFTYFSTSTNQLFQESTTSFNPITVGFSGAISQFAGSGGFMYFVTLNNQIWANNSGGTYSQLTHP
jgi:hypothetical protein